MAWDLEKIKKEIQTFISSHYPGLGCIYIITEIHRGDVENPIEVVSGSNLPQGGTCALLVQELNSRMNKLDEQHVAEAKLPVQPQGTA